MLTAAGALLLALPIALTGVSGHQPPPSCAVTDSHGRCPIVAIDPGRGVRPTTPEDTGRDRPQRSERGQPDDAGAPARSPVPNYLVRPVGDGGWVRTGGAAPPPVPGDDAPAAPAVAVPAVPVEELVQRAIDELVLDPPEPRFSASDIGFVGVPIWMWIESGAAATGPVTATATAGGASVTATGRLSAVEWSMGPPGETVRCAGPGTPWTGQGGRSPDCGYVYELRSLPERTGGTGSWSVVATSVWTVTWSGASAGLPVEGTETVLVSADAALPVGEVQVLVGGGSR